MFMEALFVISQNWKQPRCPSKGDRLNCGTFYHGILLSNEKDEMTHKTNQITRQRIMLSKKSQLPITFLK